jgi:type IX secretion system PorP/SprF family membrane protein
MSNPSFSNIDRWLFELTEGNLSPEQQAQLEAFMLQHPDLDVDKDMWKLSKVAAVESIYPNQEKLERRRPIGLFMSLGFASMAIFIGIGLFSNFTAGNSTQISTSILGNNSSNSNQKTSKVETSVNSIETPIIDNLKTLKNYSVNSSIEVVGNNEMDKRSFVENQLKVSDIENPIIESKSHVFEMQEIGSEHEIANLEESSINPSSEKNISESTLESKTENTAKEVEIVIIPKTENTSEINLVNQNSEAAIVKGTSENHTTFAKSDYNLSFSARLSKIGRSIQRMLDNPVALKNMKDPYYHVPGMQALDVNFGAVGTMLATRVQTVSRAQWLGQENQNLMNQLSIDGYSYGLRGGVGFQLNHSFYGVGGIQNYNAALIYSPKFSISRNIVVEPSIRLKMGSKKLNSDQIQTGSIVEFDRMNSQQFYNDGSSPIGQTLWYKDLGAGLMVNTKWFFVGVQADNLFQHYDNIYSSNQTDLRKAGRHFVATIGTDYESSKENLSISPYIVYQKQENLSEAWIGANIRYHWLTIGGAISSTIEPAASIGLKFNHFMVTYNADYTTSQMFNKSNLSHQITLRFLSKPSRAGQRLLNQ